MKNIILFIKLKDFQAHFSTTRMFFHAHAGLVGWVQKKPGKTTIIGSIITRTACSSSGKVSLFKNIIKVVVHFVFALSSITYIVDSNF